MRCPFCGYEDTKVVDTRPTDEGRSIRRRRECTSCNRRFTSYEKVEDIPLMVVKRDGTRQVFDRSKILTGMMKSCEKRAVTVAQLENAVKDIEKNVENRMVSEISSTDVGELVMRQLKDIDEVAYVRFASVYRQFKDVESFMRELTEILKDKKE